MSSLVVDIGPLVGGSVQEAFDQKAGIDDAYNELLKLDPSKFSCSFYIFNSIHFYSCFIESSLICLFKVHTFAVIVLQSDFT